MSNTNLVGTWKVTVASSLAANPTMAVNKTITITGSSTPTIKLDDLETVPITFTDATKLAGSFSYTPAGLGAALRTGYVHCFPAAPGKVSAIVGGSTEGDPETVAVWGGDETDPPMIVVAEGYES